MWKPLIYLPLFSNGLFIICCSSGDLKSKGTSPIRGRTFEQQAMLSRARSVAERFQACEKCSAWAASADASGALGGEDDISSGSWTPP